MPASSTSAPSSLKNVFVAATERSSPAARGSVASAAEASSESGSFVTATVSAPRSRARATYETTSGVLPDCERATTTEREKSSCAP